MFGHNSSLPVTLRASWTCTVPLLDLIAACNRRVQHHTDRAAYWRQKYEELRSTAGEHVQLVDSIANAAYSNATMHAHVGGSVALAPEFQDKVVEAMAKVSEHDKKVIEYLQWKAFFVRMQKKDTHPLITHLTLTLDDHRHFFHHGDLDGASQ